MGKLLDVSLGDGEGRVILADKFEKPGNPMDAIVAPSGLFGFALDNKGNRLPVTKEVVAVIDSKLRVLFAQHGCDVSTRRPQPSDAFALAVGETIRGWVKIGKKEHQVPYI